MLRATSLKDSRPVFYGGTCEKAPVVIFHRYRRGTFWHDVAEQRHARAAIARSGTAIAAAISATADQPYRAAGFTGSAAHTASAKSEPEFRAIG